MRVLLATGGWKIVLCGLLIVNLVADVESWGGFKSWGGEISRAVHQATREVERVGVQIKTETENFGTKIVQEADKFGDQVQAEADRAKAQVGSWIPSGGDIEEEAYEPIPEAPAVARGCAPLISATVAVSCRSETTRINCSLPMPVGTVAQLVCKKGYYAKEDWVPASISCTTELSWSHPLYTCVPDCGKRNTGGQSSSSKRQIVEYPWHITIYKLNAAGLYDIACSGTLITPTLVLSAATCFWDPATNKPRPPVEFKVAAGRPRVDWSAADATLQRRDVAEIIVNERYLGRRRLLANDVALVKVTHEMTLSSDVNVACVDWIHDLDESEITEGSVGTVASWMTSPSYSPLRLPFIPFLQCSDTIEENLQEYITNDKFCAGSADKTVAVCSSDAGTGFTLPLDTVRGQRLYVRGISTAPLDTAAGDCSVQKVALFTHFSAYRKWFAQTVFQGRSL